jgi:hypothetical protein
VGIKSRYGPRAEVFFRDDVKGDGIEEKERVYEGEYIFIFTMDDSR